MGTSKRREEKRRKLQTTKVETKEDDIPKKRKEIQKEDKSLSKKAKEEKVQTISESSETSESSVSSSSSSPVQMSEEEVEEELEEKNVQEQGGPPRSSLRTHYRVQQRIRGTYGGGPVHAMRGLDDVEVGLVVEGSGKLYVLDAASGAEKRAVELHGHGIVAFSTHPSKPHVYVATVEGEIVEMRVRRASEDRADGDGEVVRRWKSGHHGTVSTLAIDGSGAYLASAGSTGPIRVWDAAGGYATHQFKGHRGPVHQMRFDPDVRKLALYSCGSDGSLRVWNLRTRDCQELKNHLSDVTGVEFLSSGRLVSCGRDRVLTVWGEEEKKVEKEAPKAAKSRSLRPYALVRTIPTYLAAHGLVRVSQNTVVVFCDGGLLQTWDVSSGVKRREWASASSNEAVHCCVLPEARLAVLGTNDAQLLWHELSDDFSLKKLMVGAYDTIRDLCAVRSGDLSRLAVVRNTADLLLLHVPTHAAQLLRGHTAMVLCVASSADGRFLASAGKDNTIRLWASDSGLAVGICEGHTADILSLCFSRRPSSSGAFLMSSDASGLIKQWDITELYRSMDSSKSIETKSIETKSIETKSIEAKSFGARFSVQAHSGDVATIGVAPNDRMVATGGHDRKVRLWDAETGRELRTLEGHRRGVWGLAFAPVDRVLATASADHTVRLWSVADGRCLHTLEGHSSAVLRVAFVGVGAQLLSAGADGLLRLWNVRTGECVGSFEGHTDRVWALAAAADGNQLVTAGEDGSLVIWEDCTDELAEGERRLRKDRLRKEQRMLNAARAGDWQTAVSLALELEQPARAYATFETMLATADRHLVGRLLASLSGDALVRLLSYVVAWNTHAHHCFVAQSLLHALLTHVPPQTLCALPDIRKSLEALIPYTHRHCARIDRYAEHAYLIDFAIQSLTGLPSETTL